MNYGRNTRLLKYWRLNAYEFSAAITIIILGNEIDDGLVKGMFPFQNRVSVIKYAQICKNILFSVYSLRSECHQMQTASVVLVSDIGILLFNLLFKRSYYLTYYFGNFSYPIIYPIVTFTYRKVKNYPIKNSNMCPPSVSVAGCIAGCICILLQCL